MEKNKLEDEIALLRAADLAGAAGIGACAPGRASAIWGISGQGILGEPRVQSELQEPPTELLLLGMLYIGL